MVRQLESSVAGRWRERTAGADERYRNWRTRLGYYRAIVEALRRDGVDTVDMHHIVGEHGSGRQSTFYALAARGLVHVYRRHQDPPTRAVGDLVSPEPVPHLVAETKVWSFWPLRTEWIREIDDWFPTGDFTETSKRLVRRLVEWQTTNPTLAAAQNGLPPLCAVEDLMVLSRHAITAKQASQQLIRAVAVHANGLDKGRTVIDLGIPSHVLRPRRVWFDEVEMAKVIAQINAVIGLIRASGSVTTGPSADDSHSAVNILRAAVREMTKRLNGIPNGEGHV